MNLDTLRTLQAHPEWLADLHSADLSDAALLPLLTHLRKRHSPEVAAALVETARLRHKGVAKFARAGGMFFTADGLQQATHAQVAEHHARLLAGFAWVVDAGCGIGGDSLHIGQQTRVIGLDYDPVRLHMARHNTVIYGAQADFIQADLRAPLPFSHIPAVFFDPARRDEQKRIFSVADYHPPLDTLTTWPTQAVLVKLSPGVQIDEVKGFDGGLEFVSYGGELKEALLHLGGLRFDGRRATLFPSGESLSDQGLDAPPVTDKPLRYLYEPDPALIRAGLFGELLAYLGLDAYRLDDSIAYLTGDTPIETPWLRGWPLHDWLPFNLKKLRAALVGYGVGQVTVKKRGSPIQPEELQRLLKLKSGGAHAVVILTQLRGQHVALISLDNPG